MLFYQDHAPCQKANQNRKIGRIAFLSTIFTGVDTKWQLIVCRTKKKCWKGRSSSNGELFKLKCILRTKLNCSIKRDGNVREVLKGIYYSWRELCWWLSLLLPTNCCFRACCRGRCYVCYTTSFFLFCQLL